MKTLNLFAMPGHLSAGVVCVSPMELAAGQKSARVRHAQPWSAERGLLIQLPTVYTGGTPANTTVVAVDVADVITAGVTTENNSITAPSAHERSRT